LCLKNNTIDQIFQIEQIQKKENKILIEQKETDYLKTIEQLNKQIFEIKNKQNQLNDSDFMKRNKNKNKNKQPEKDFQLKSIQNDYKNIIKEFGRFKMIEDKLSNDYIRYMEYSDQIWKEASAEYNKITNQQRNLDKYYKNSMKKIIQKIIQLEHNQTPPKDLTLNFDSKKIRNQCY